MAKDASRPFNSTIRRALPTYYALLFAILTVFGIMILIRLRHVLLILFISVLFAAALAQPAEFLTRFRIPRAVAVVLLYVAVGALLALVGWLVVFPVLSEISSLSNELPDYADRLEGARRAYMELSDQYPQLESFDEQFSNAGQRISEQVGQKLIGLPLTVAQLAFDGLSVFFISILLVTNRERMRDLALLLVHPDDRDQWEDVLTKIWTRLGYYLRAKIIVMTIVGILMCAGLLFLGVRFPFLLAIIVAAVQIIPRIGPWIGRVPLVGIAALDGVEMVIYLMLLSVLIENLKGYLIAPLIEADQLDTHPLSVFISVLAGGALLGIPGAFIAVPAVAALQVVFEEVILPWRIAQYENEETPGHPCEANSPADSVTGS